MQYAHHRHCEDAYQAMTKRFKGTVITRRCPIQRRSAIHRARLIGRPKWRPLRYDNRLAMTPARRGMRPYDTLLLTRCIKLDTI